MNDSDKDLAPRPMLHGRHFTDQLFGDCTSTQNYTVWYTGQHGRDPLEAYWIELLLAQAADPRYPRRNVLVICSFDKWGPIVEQIPDPNEWGLVALDEANRIGTETFRRFRFNLRIGFANGQYGANVLPVPLYAPKPFLTAVGPARTADPAPRYLWSFCGCDGRGGRKEMLRELMPLQPNFVHRYSSGWMPPEVLPYEIYAQTLTASMFAPSPSGSQHPECYRTYEALHCGAVPIVTTPYYRQQFGAPFPIAATWTEARELMESFWNDRVAFAKLREACMTWYSGLPALFGRRVAELIAAAEVKGHVD